VGAGHAFEDKDAIRRTQLANERTFLAWWRSGITALGVSLAVGRVVPALGDQTGWPYAVVGAFYGILGLAMVLYGSFRQRQVEDGIERGEFVSMNRRLVTGFTVLAVAIGIGTLVLIVAEG
jgi:inner membrane protein YidH